MMDPDPSTSHRPRSVTEDRISSLPEIAIDAILIRLPLKEAARTSILSRSWRYEWTNLSQLVFHWKEFRTYEYGTQDDYDSDIVDIVDQVLLFHQGSIHRFQLSGIRLRNWKCIDRWLCFISRNGVREFVLRRYEDGLIKIPSCVFSCKELVYLELSFCELTLPSSFRGLGNLKSLYLSEVNFSRSSLEKLITMCPLLAKLALRNIIGCSSLTICAPNLVELTVESEIDYLCLDKTSVLAKSSLNLFPDAGLSIGTSNESGCKLTDLLRCLPGIKRLELTSPTYQFLAGGEVPVTLLTNCQLSYLSVSIDFKDVGQLSLALWILRSCPLLQEFHIQMQTYLNEDTEDPFVDLISRETRDHCDLSLNHLQILRLENYIGSKTELRFIEFVLANAPVLEMVQIEVEDDNEPTHLLKGLLQLRRISSKSHIVISE